MYTVDFVGLIYFNVCNGGRVAAYVPDGTKDGGGHIPVHFASIMIPEQRLQSDDWWTDQKLRRGISIPDSITTKHTEYIYEFRIMKRAELTFACSDSRLDITNLAASLPQLKAIDPDFVLDPSGAIAEIPIGGGTLETCRFDPAAIVRWTIETHPDEVTITAATSGEKKTIVLKKGDGAPIEVVFANAPDYLEIVAAKPGNDPHHGHPATQANSEHDHFALYGKLNKGPNGATKFENVSVPDFTKLKLPRFTHPYLKALVQHVEIPNGKCVPICC